MKKFSVAIWQSRTPCTGAPPKFVGRVDAVQWAVAQGAFGIDEACQRFDEMVTEFDGANVYPFWIREVGRRLWSIKRT